MPWQCADDDRGIAAMSTIAPALSRNGDAHTGIRVLPAMRGRSAGLITVCGWRAGQGSTTFAIALASDLAQRGRHVLLVDADPAMGTIRTVLRVRHEGRSVHALLSHDEFSVELIERLAVGLSGTPGLSVIGGVLSLPNPPIMDHILPRLAQVAPRLPYDHVVVDVGAPFAYPGVRDLDGIAAGISRASTRTYVVMRDELATVPLAMAVLSPIRQVLKAEAVLWEGSGGAATGALLGTWRARLPEIPIVAGMRWDERRYMELVCSGRSGFDLSHEVSKALVLT